MPIQFPLRFDEVPVTCPGIETRQWPRQPVLAAELSILPTCPLTLPALKR